MENLVRNLKMFKRGIEMFKGIRGKTELLQDIARLEQEVRYLKDELAKHRKTAIRLNGHSVLYKDVVGEYNDMELGV